MRSVVVVLPASMCAMMPMLRQRSRGKVRATAEYLVRCGRSRALLDWMKDCLRKNGLPQRTRAFTWRGTPRQVLGRASFGGMDPAARLDAALENARRFFVGQADVQQALRKLARLLDEDGIAYAISSAR